MGGSSGGSGTQKIIQEPWTEAKPYYENLYKAGEGFLNNPATSGAYQGQTYAGPNATQQQALGGVRGVVPRFQQQADAVSAAQGGFQQQAGRYGSLGDAAIAASADYRPAQQGYQSLAGLAGAQVPGMQTGQTELRGLAGDTISGKYMNADSNPYLSGALDAATRGIWRQFNEQTLPGIQSSALANGTYGGDRSGLLISDALRGAMSDSMDKANEIYYGNYDRERDRQLNAGSLYGQANNLGFDAMRASAAGAEALKSSADINKDILGMQAQGLQWKDNANQQILAALGLGDRSIQTALEGQQLLGQTGDQEQIWAQDALDAAYAKWGQDRDAMWDPVQRFATLLANGGFSSQTQTNSIPRSSSMFQGAVGGGLNGYMMGQQFGMDPRMAALIGSALGGASGY